MCYVLRVGQNIIRSEIAPVRSPTLKERFFNVNTGYYFSTERLEHSFFEGWGAGRWGAYLFSELEKCRRGVRMTFEVETLFPVCCKFVCFFISARKGRYQFLEGRSDITGWFYINLLPRASPPHSSPGP